MHAHSLSLRPLVVLIAASGLLHLAATPALAQGGPQPCTLGSWEGPFNHGGTAPPNLTCWNPSITFPIGYYNAIHMSLIPKGPHQGHVLVWDHVHYAGSEIGQTRTHFFSIFDPATQTFWNHWFCLPADQGDLFCAGHAWNANGDLVIAGGTSTHCQNPVNNPCGGARFLYVWQPPTTLGGGGTWNPGPPLDQKRWYPSLLMLGPDPNDLDRDKILVLGGTHNGSGIDSYQCWRPVNPPAGSWQLSSPGNEFKGPTTAPNTLPPAQYILHNYPRTHFMSTWHSVTAGMVQGSSRVNHSTSPGIWPIGWLQSNARSYGSSVLYPISPGGSPFKDLIVSMGGLSVWATGVILNTAEVTNGGLASPSWQAIASMTHARWLLNTVLLPDSTIFAVGGEKQYRNVSCSEVPALTPELYAFGAWSPMMTGTIIRDYHSTALLLPSGKVLTGGGESRQYAPWANCANTTGRMPSVSPSDYQVFVPPYIQCGNVRPNIRNQVTWPTNPNAFQWAYGSQPTVTYDALPFGITISKVVLMRAGSLTHHADLNQRCVELPFEVLPDTDPPSPFRAVQVTVPAKTSYLLPRGYYMLCLVTNQGTPSPAAWVLLQ